MNKFLAGGLAAIATGSAGFWLWQSQAAQEKTDIPAPPPPSEMAMTTPEELPKAGPGAPRFGPAPPNPLSAPKASREEARFNRYDRNRDDSITRIEMMSSRTKAFKKLDTDGNNLLTFEEWAAATSQRFARADNNRDRMLTRIEFAATKPKAAAKPACRC
jgi:hypothetical protein